MVTGQKNIFVGKNKKQKNKLRSFPHNIYNNLLKVGHESKCKY